MRTRKISPKVLALLVLLSILLGACRASSPENTLTILAGSELRDIEPLLEQIQRDTGLNLQMQYVGSLEGAERLQAGETVDLAWFSHAKYLNLLQGAEGKAYPQERIMLSPVIMGVKESKARQWGWIDNPAITWQDIVDKAQSGELRYAMTNPTSSNTGFSALVGVAAALSGKSDALTTTDIRQVSDRLQDFFKGQVLTSGSSGWLAEQYVKEQDRLDGMINYESVLLGLNQSNELNESLYLVYPKEGIITADYPLLLINPEKRQAYDTLVAYLRSPAFQEILMEKTLRRPAVANVPLSPFFPAQLLIELPFPNSLEVVNQLLFNYLDVARVPPHSFFLLDVSGSMKGERLENLKEAIRNLAGGDPSLTGQFARFLDREKVTILIFSGQVEDIRQFEVDLANPETIEEIAQYVDSLSAGGRTAIYSTLKEGYELALEAQTTDPQRYYTIVLMSDGENTAGISESDFIRFFRSLTQGTNIKTFPILFGEADKDAMEAIANETGGRVFDAKTETLSTIFKQIRGYQ